MKGIAKFEKVSYNQFRKDMLDCFPGIEAYAVGLEKTLTEMYNNIKLPQRATAGSAGYDFHIPYAALLTPGTFTKVPTGIRCKMEPGWVLHLYPRSGLGFKHGVRLTNTVGIIDSDYYNAKNEGHIMAMLNTDKEAKLADGQAFMQGVFLMYGVTADDAADGVRTGGFGSTDKQGV